MKVKFKFKVAIGDDMPTVNIDGTVEVPEGYVNVDMPHKEFDEKIKLLIFKGIEEKLDLTYSIKD